jgi:16S rRNA (guanine527-N7)-methyltransferase
MLEYLTQLAGARRVRRCKLDCMQIGSAQWQQLIVEGSRAFGIEIESGVAEQFAVHARELVHWTARINLTAITDAEEIAVKHILDSLAPVALLPDHATLLDIGSGGGFPGIPLKLVRPSLEVSLIDASRKKVTFLRHVIRALGLSGIQALHVRAEALGRSPEAPHQFQVIISRALSPLEPFLRMALPLLAPAGMIIAMKGKVTDSEASTARDRVLARLSVPDEEKSHISLQVQSYRLPLLNSQRSLVILQKRPRTEDGT